MSLSEYAIFIYEYAIYEYAILNLVPTPEKDCLFSSFVRIFGRTEVAPLHSLRSKLKVSEYTS